MDLENGAWLRLEGKENREEPFKDLFMCMCVYERQGSPEEAVRSLGAAVTGY